MAVYQLGTTGPEHLLMQPQIKISSVFISFPRRTKGDSLDSRRRCIAVDGQRLAV